MSVQRRIIESPLMQGEDERIVYSLTTTPWGSSPLTVSVVLKTYPGLVDVSSTNLSGSVVVAGDVITSPIVHSLAAGSSYRLEYKFTVTGNVLEAYAIIRGEE